MTQTHLLRLHACPRRLKGRGNTEDMKTVRKMWASEEQWIPILPDPSVPSSLLYQFQCWRSNVRVEGQWPVQRVLVSTLCKHQIEANPLHGLWVARQQLEVHREERWGELEGIGNGGWNVEVERTRLPFRVNWTWAHVLSSPRQARSLISTLGLSALAASAAISNPWEKYQWLGPLLGIAGNQFWADEHTYVTNRDPTLVRETLGWL